ncbi:MAG: SpoIID/LytB domain-containing protein [Bacteroidales bacterium]|jgi:stage II sporulation protein D|nr:SpoIID/LytB domain-containing protein [Bacteroidales bacterium]
MIRMVIYILWLLLPLTTAGQVSIRIFARTKPVTVIFTPERGGYLLNDGAPGALRLRPGETVAVTRYDDKVVYKTLSGTYGAADSLSFVPLDASSLFSLRAAGSMEPVKRLDGSLKIRSFPGSLMVLNITSVESYLPGVVRAEAGKYGPPDYFRAQAVVARTYVYRNIGRHELDGYNLCDDTHCQVYPGIISESLIVDACRSTDGQVLIDRDSMLIVAAFHGNCGGVTASSADVWLAAWPYLVSLSDPWCSYSASSTWKKSLPLKEWNSFLATKGITPGEAAALYSPPGSKPVRIANRSAGGKTLSSEEIRTYFGLRSALFTMTHVGDSIVLSGRGYGHGVGLCQDGAKHMAEKHMTYDKITGFYYPGTMITDVKNARRPVKP